MQPTQQQTRSTTKQRLIPIVIEPEDELEDPIVVPLPIPPPSPELTPTEPEIPVAPPRPGGEKIPPGGWRGTEAPRPGGEKIPPGGWRSEDLDPGGWRSTPRIPILIPVDEPPLNSWDGQVYRTTDGRAYFHFKTTIVAHVLPPEEAGTGSVLASLVEYWTFESGLVSLESMITDEGPIPAFLALARMSTHVQFEPEGPEQIGEAFTQLQSQLGTWAETLWEHINDQEYPINDSTFRNPHPEPGDDEQ